ncbi:PEP-CTERM sorting domain-containing protein [Paraglaciecola sp. L1A13]|uniref:Npun_F0296 family exosortase-dependent surface protein n=1 Tax=Paraglaciecola sp. L1A13 TaxID=2686359 RepID=UPI00131EC94A|nr:PEP-CTERM sorting domain-containing protein [Paraglaciecola sp. L1A13]
MTNLVKNTKLVTLAALLAFGAASQASAASITFGGQIATDGSGVTSSRIDASNQITAATVSNGYFVETFDSATAYPIGAGGDTQYNIAGSSTGCQVNSPLGISPSALGVVGVRNDSVPNVAAAPAGDSTCYAYTTPETIGTDSFVDIDYSTFLTNIGSVETSLIGAKINYLGFYWGSVDTYNSFEFYSGSTLVASISGTALLAEFNGTSGNQTSPASNTYVNLDFSDSEAFDNFKVISSGIAGEFDNIVVGLKVPAPASLAFLGLGLLGLGLGKRFKK